MRAPRPHTPRQDCISCTRQASACRIFFIFYNFCFFLERMEVAPHPRHIRKTYGQREKKFASAAPESSPVFP